MNYMDQIEIGKWHDVTNYQCKLCPYATIGGLQKILDHVGGHFGAKPLEPAYLVRNQPIPSDEEE